MRALRGGRGWGQLAGGSMLVLRWLALLATLYLSLHHWMRAGYWEYSGIWQYGLPLLDPRFAGALVWWLISTSFWVLVALPAAQWLARQLATRDLDGRVPSVVLALGLGTRGAVGPLLIRAVCGSPLALARPGAAPESLLDHSVSARWLVLLTQSWWVIPLLVVTLRLLGVRTTEQRSVRWLICALLAVFAFLQPPDAAYLLTAGGPHGATQSVLLLALQEGFGREEFGYASVLAVMGCIVVIPLAPFLRAPILRTPFVDRQECREVPQMAHLLPWLLLGGASLAIPILAWQHNPGMPSAPSDVWRAASISLLLAAASGLWSGYLGRILTAQRDRSLAFRSELFRNTPLLFPSLVMILPLLRPWGYRAGVGEGFLLVVGMVFAAPHLLISATVQELLRRRGVAAALALRAAGLAVGWAVWTELSTDLMLSQSPHPLLPLQGWMVWKLSTSVYASPLAVPGWLLAWVGGVFLAWLTLHQLFHAIAPDPKRAGRILPASP